MTTVLLYTTTTALGLGLFLKFVLDINPDIPWAIGGLVGLIPAIKWVVDELKDRQMGSDILAIFSILGALAIKEFFAASVISFMLASGRALESWAEGRAESALKSLIDRMPKLANRITLSGALELISVDNVALGDRLIVKSGEIIPVDGIAQESCYLDQSALTGEPLPVDAALEAASQEQKDRGEWGVATVAGRTSQALAKIAPKLVAAGVTGGSSLLGQSLAAGGLFGLDDEGNFHPKDAAFAALFPVVGKAGR